MVQLRMPVEFNLVSIHHAQYLIWSNEVVHSVPMLFSLFPCNAADRMLAHRLLAR